MNVLVKNLGHGIKNVTINDPKTYNSLSFATLRSLLNTFKKLDKDNTTKVIILEDNFFVSFGAFNFVQGNFNAGPNCFNICFIPSLPPAR